MRGSKGGARVPFGVLIATIDMLLLVHIIKTGRFYPWAFVLVLLPGVGAAIYVTCELAPEWLGLRAGRSGRATNVFGTSVRYKELRAELAVVDTNATRAALAQECLDMDKFEEAREHYHTILSRPLGDEPAYMLGRARAEYGLDRFADCVATLEQLIKRWSTFSSPDSHLLYARALEGVGRYEEALANYENVGRYYPGVEPRVRKAILLVRLGRGVEGRALAEDVVRALGRAPAHIRRNQRIWLNEARRLTKI
jgi:hypothetical protein